MTLFSGTWSSSALREPGKESCSSDDEWTSWSLSSIATGATVHSAISNHKGAHKHKDTHPHTHIVVSKNGMGREDAQVQNGETRVEECLQGGQMKKKII